MSLAKNLCVVFLFLFSLARAQTQLELDAIAVEAKDQSELPGLELPSEDLPLSLSLHGKERLSRNKVKRLAELSRVDAAVTDSYNSTGYWDGIRVRGFDLSPRSSFQREGLPISGETSIPLENKERIEVIKGASHVNSGEATPAGLVNFVVKRPVDGTFNSLSLEASERSNLTLALDSNRKLGSRIQARLNLARENIDPLIRDARGERSLLAGAVAFELPKNSSLAAEVEWSRRSQPSTPGLSLLGDRLPAPVDPNLNLNGQRWQRPVVFGALTGSLRYTRELGARWFGVLTLGMQRLRTDDRLAFPYGCGKEGRFDRFCSDGTFDVYDYRSEDEERLHRSLQLSLTGRLEQGGLVHNLNLGIRYTDADERANRQAFNFVGEGDLSGERDLPADPSLTGNGTNRASLTTDVFASDRLELGATSLWLGTKFSRLHRRSFQTDGSERTSFGQEFFLPWVALGHKLETVLAYLSYAEGIEAFVTPNKVSYQDPGKQIPGVRSRRFEAGMKSASLFPWELSVFHVRRPHVADLPPAFEVDGETVQTGVEASAQKDFRALALGASVMWLEMKLQDSKLLEGNNGRKPVNVPAATVRTFLDYRLPAVRGLSLLARWTHEGKRAVLADNSIMLPAWSKWDLGLLYKKKTWSTELYLENAFARRYWRESPFQYGHVYLFPGPDRRLTWSLQTLF